MDRLFVEAQAVNLINHPHVVEISDILVPDADQPDHALVMELLDGRRSPTSSRTDGPLPPARYLPIMAQICAGLAAVHRAGFVHRDLKPENVFLVERGGNRDFVKLLDFGLVKALRRRRRRRHGDDRRDVHGLAGVRLARAVRPASRSTSAATSTRSASCCTSSSPGQLPFVSEHVADLLMKQINAAPPRLSDELLATDLGRALDAIIQACLIKDPAERALSAAQLADMFGRLAAGDHAMPADLPAAPPPARGDGSGAAAPSSIAPLVALGVLGFFAVQPPARRRRLRRRRHRRRPCRRRTWRALRRPRRRRRRRRRPIGRQPAGAAPASRRWARTPPRLSKAMTLDPYR